MRDLELLRIEMGVLWDVDTRDRIHGPIDIAVGIASDGIATVVGQHVRDDVVADVLGHADAASVPDRLRELQTPDLALSGGPSYYVDRPIGVHTDARIVRSDDPRAEDMLTMRPDNWEPDEWVELINGGTGAPWAMVLDADRVVSICHTPRRTSVGAEAGTWTAPEFRGRGYAAATTAAWSELLSTHLFYSTSADNYSSQRVAERLGLRPIGWIWKLTRSGPPTDPATGTPPRDGE